VGTDSCGGSTTSDATCENGAWKVIIHGGGFPCNSGMHASEAECTPHPGCQWNDAQASCDNV
jgi:hypothetical protein